MSIGERVQVHFFEHDGRQLPRFERN
jgi:hypothetical protein